MMSDGPSGSSLSQGFQDSLQELDFRPQPQGSRAFLRAVPVLALLRRHCEENALARKRFAP